MPSEIILARAVRLLPPHRPGTWAQLRCGAVEWPAGALERGFVTPQYVMCWVAAGAGTFRDASGREWRLEAGNVFQRFPDARHDIASHGLTRWWFIGVPAAVHEALRQVGLPSLSSPVIDVGLDRRLPARFTALVRRLRDAPEDGLAACLAAMLEFMVELHGRAGRARASDPHAEAIDAVCRMIAADPARRLRPTALARQAGLGYHAFRKAFARRMGCGVSSWALRQRLQLAQELLSDAALPVAEIASRVGYRDPLQFSAIFRRRFGVCPRAWRRGA